jgi:hypothetical protein
MRLGIRLIGHDWFLSQYAPSPSNAKGKKHHKTVIYYRDFMEHLACGDKQLFQKLISKRYHKY